MTQVEVAILGAGPHGLAAAAHLRRAGIEVRVLGEPLSFWQTMPVGMLLRSNWTATCIGEYDGPLSLDSFCTATGDRFGLPVPLDRFVSYGMWVQAQVAPDVDRRFVERVELEPNGFRLTFADGDHLRAGRVVVAGGISPFAHRPKVAAGVPAELASHSGDHRDLSRFAGRRVLVVGGGQSALESAALLHESGADVEVAVRNDRVIWLHGGKYHRMLGRWAPLVYAPTDVGPMGLSRLVAVPDLFGRLPRQVQDPLAYRSIRPAAAAWLGPRLADVPVHLNAAVKDLRPVGDQVQVQLAPGLQRTVDHVLFGTGYRVDIARYEFLESSMTDRIERVDGYPVLGRGLQSSVPGLHFVGAPAARSFGPILRFVAGGWYAGRELARAVRQADRRRPGDGGTARWAREGAAA